MSQTTAAVQSLRPKAAESGIVEALIKPAAAVGVDPKQFLNLEPEDPISENPETGLCIYSYRELVRQNHFKDYKKVIPGELENHLTDEDFFEKFSMTKVSDYIHNTFRFMCYNYNYVLF
jgi:hypothetical protein